MTACCCAAWMLRTSASSCASIPHGVDAWRGKGSPGAAELDMLPASAAVRSVRAPGHLQARLPMRPTTGVRCANASMCVAASMERSGGHGRASADGTRHHRVTESARWACSATPSHILRRRSTVMRDLRLTVATAARVGVGNGRWALVALGSNTITAYSYKGAMPATARSFSTTRNVMTVCGPSRA
jgi:hypothetical protein